MLSSTAPGQARTTPGTVLVIGTADTKRAELGFVRDRIAATGLRTEILDISTRDPAAAGVDVSAREIAAGHPQGAEAVFTGERGSAVAAMAAALETYLGRRDDIGGVIGLGGSGGTALIAPALQALPLGLPKLLVSTVASGNVAPYVGASDITIMYSVTDISGLNAISRTVLANAAAAIAGMARDAAGRRSEAGRPALGLTMFGVTTPCVQAIGTALEADYDCIVFHATGAGGATMEKLAASGLLTGVLDITTTEIADRIAGGIMPAHENRLSALAGLGLPYLGSLGALDMVNFGAIDTVPERYRGRLLHAHNPQITLMRTSPEENAAAGRLIAERLAGFTGPVRLLVPEGGVSALDAPGQPFCDEAADRALFDAVETHFRETGRHRLLRLPHHINDPEFARAAVAAFREMVSGV